MPEEKLSKTPLHRLHLQLGGRMVPFAGYEMPVQYSGVLDETRRVREAAGLFDVSHMGQFSVKGAKALEAVQAVVSNDLTKLQLGQAQYNMLLNHEGGVIDDLVVYRRKEDEIFICVNASNRAADFAWMKEHLAKDVTLTDLSDELALIALQGPKAEAILSMGTNPELAKSLKYYWAAEAPVFGHACYVSRTGYTGEDGYELYVAREHAIDLWEKLTEAGRKDGVIACGLGARDTLRLEMGYPLHGHELSPTISPLSAGLGWVVKLQRATPFIGQEALRKEAAAGSARVLRAFVVNDRRIARQGYRIANEKHEAVGEITSGTFSPHRNSPIALGFVDRAEADKKLLIEVRESFLEAEVVKLPFVPSHTKKN